MDKEDKAVNVTDEELVKFAQSGDRQAEEILINKYKDMVKGKAHLYFIVGADSEDVVQEGMIGIFKAVRDYQPDKNASFKTFVDICVNRQIITAIKRAGRQKHSPLNTSVSLSKPVGDDSEGETLETVLPLPNNMDPEMIMVARDTIDRIIINAPKLFSKFEQQVWEEYLKGKNYLVIADIMNRPPKSIDNAIQRIKKKITAYLEE